MKNASLLRLLLAVLVSGSGLLYTSCSSVEPDGIGGVLAEGTDPLPPTEVETRKPDNFRPRQPAPGGPLRWKMEF